MQAKTLDVSIRKARKEDAEFLAVTILMATRSHLPRGWFDIALDRSEADCLEFLRRLTVARARSQWHYSRFLVAHTGGCPVAALSAARAAEAYPMAPAALGETLKSSGVTQSERALFWSRGEYLFTCTMRPDADALTIECIATLPNGRGKGYTAALLAQALQEARAQGIQHAETTCFIGNACAERAYVRAGFHFAGERRHNEFEAIAGAAGIRRFVRAL